MKKDNPLRGEERRVISTKLYRSEFVNFLRLCEMEGKTIHAKLREMVRGEIEDYSSKSIFIKQKEDIENAEKKLKQRFQLEIKREKKDVQ